MKCCSLMIALVLVQSLSSCSNDKHSDAANLPAAVIDKSSNTGDLPAKPQYLYIRKDSIYVVVDKKTFCIKRDPTINYKNSYAGIYEIHGDSIKKSYSLSLNNLIYFTTFADGIGYKGYLYVFNPNNKTMVTDPDFKHNYLYSFWGMFIIDRKTNKIFSVNPSWYDQDRTPIVAASMYSINGNHFKFHKLIYERFNNVEEDTTIIKFYHKSLANNAKNGLLFPEKWWK